MRTSFEDVRPFKVRRIVGNCSGLNILDVCCADGSILAPLARTNRLFGVDWTPMVEHAKANGYEAVHRCDMERDKFPYPAESFDLVFAGECIEHVANTQHFLNEINRMLKPRGTLVVTTPNVRTVQTLLRMLVANLPSPAAAQWDNAHVRDFTTKVLRNVLAAHGFEVTKMIGTDFTLWLPGKGVFKGWKRLADFLPGWASGIIAVAEKTSTPVTSNNPPVTSSTK